MSHLQNVNWNCALLNAYKSKVEGSKSGKNAMDGIPVYAVSYSNGYKPDAGLSGVRAVLLFTVYIWVRMVSFFHVTDV